MENINLHIEAIIFTARQAVTIPEIQKCLGQLLGEEAEKPTEEEIETHLETIGAKYDEVQFAFQLVNISDGYQFLTRPIYHQSISIYLNQKAKRRLSKSALETLAIIAYKQPITKAEIEQIRGVNCDYSVQKLLEKDLISIIGRSDTPGKPILYGSSQFFMDYFGLRTMADLPKLKDIQPEKNEIGKPEADDGNAAEMGLHLVSNEVPPEAAASDGHLTDQEEEE